MGYVGFADVLISVVAGDLTSFPRVEFWTYAFRESPFVREACESGVTENLAQKPGQQLIEVHGQIDLDLQLEFKPCSSLISATRGKRYVMSVCRWAHFGPWRCLPPRP